MTDGSEGSDQAVGSEKPAKAESTESTTSTSKPTGAPVSSRPTGDTAPSEGAGPGRPSSETTKARRVSDPKASPRPAGTRAQAHSALGVVRTRIASVIWLVAVLGAIVLAVGALLIALGANTDNVLVAAVLNSARAIDGPFWRVFDFYKETKGGAQGAPDEVKNHLVNWGLAAVGYLIAGRVLSRIIRP